MWRYVVSVVEMARRSGTAPADGRRPEPLFTVLVGSLPGGVPCLAGDPQLRAGDAARAQLHDVAGEGVEDL